MYIFLIVLIGSDRKTSEALDQQEDHGLHWGTGTHTY